MTRIVIADKAGVCYGVARALGLVRKAVRDHAGKVSTLGPLIHNPSVVAELESSGVRVVGEPEEAAGTALVLRAHGVTPDVEQRAATSAEAVLDATCPYVKNAQGAAALLAREGYQVIVVGEKGHPEVDGLVAYAGNATVVANASEVADLELCDKVGVVVQTTQTRDNLAEVASALVGRVKELRIMDTICDATSERQAAAAKLASEADAMVVIGGRNSANTRHLAEICAAGCANTHHVELSEELEAAWFADARTIGITAGASTPQSQIDEAFSRIKALVRE